MNETVKLLVYKQKYYLVAVNKWSLYQVTASTDWWQIAPSIIQNTINQLHAALTEG